jgi:hypothetical protein
VHKHVYARNFHADSLNFETHDVVRIKQIHLSQKLKLEGVALDLDNFVGVRSARWPGAPCSISATENSNQTPRIIHEVARKVLKEKNFGREDIVTSPMCALELPQNILTANENIEYKMRFGTS